RDLRAQVAEGRVREDLYFRLGRPVVALPPLRDRPEEVAWHVERAVRAVGPDLALHASLVEACLLRHWPGNVRDLLAEVRTAAIEAASDGRPSVEAKHLSASAGQRFERASDPGRPDAAAPTPDERSPRPPWPEADALRSALREENGNISATARRL